MRTGRNAFFALLEAGVLVILAEALKASAGELVPVPLERLQAPPVSRLGRAALGIEPETWLHAETANFAYHYSASRPANEAAVEAEFYYAFFSRELGRNTSDWQRKGHIFIFESDVAWKAFQQGARLDPWTGGIHSNNELFILRSTRFRYAGHTLAHEVAHLVLFRFFGAGIPLWLNEGYAEYAGGRAWATFYRMRGLMARTRLRPVSAEALIPMSEFTAMTDYPEDPVRAGIFYNQSERLVRFLSAADKTGFLNFLEAMSRGNSLDSALGKAFALRYPTVTHLEREFAKYVSQEFFTAAGEGAGR